MVIKRLVAEHKEVFHFSDVVTLLFGPSENFNSVPDLYVYKSSTFFFSEEYFFHFWPSEQCTVLIRQFIRSCL